MSKPPAISVILCVKNGMPYLDAALTSMREQTFRDFDIIVQDSASTDGTLELLNQYTDLPLKIISEPDGGIGDAYNRAVARCTGDIVASIDSDNLLAADALETAARVFREDPALACFYTYVRMIEADGTEAHAFEPDDFSLEKLLCCELVPPYSTSFFSRPVCGDLLRFEPSMKTCADFDLWLRLSHLKIKRIRKFLGYTRMSESSMTCRPETYDQYCTDKLAALDRFLARTDRPLKRDRSSYAAGIYLWAASAIYYMNGADEQCLEYYRQAKELAPSYDWVTRFEKEFLASAN